MPEWKIRKDLVNRSWLCPFDVRSLCFSRKWIIYCCWAAMDGCIVARSRTHILCGSMISSFVVRLTCHTSCTVSMHLLHLTLMHDCFWTELVDGKWDMDCCSYRLLLLTRNIGLYVHTISTYFLWFKNIVCYVFSLYILSDFCLILLPVLVKR